MSSTTFFSTQGLQRFDLVPIYCNPGIVFSRRHPLDHRLFLGQRFHGHRVVDLDCDCRPAASAEEATGNSLPWPVTGRQSGHPGHGNEGSGRNLRQRPPVLRAGPRPAKHHPPDAFSTPTSWTIRKVGAGFSPECIIKTGMRLLPSSGCGPARRGRQKNVQG